MSGSSHGKGPKGLDNITCIFYIYIYYTLLLNLQVPEDMIGGRFSLGSPDKDCPPLAEEDINGKETVRCTGGGVS